MTPAAHMCVTVQVPQSRLHAVPTFPPQDAEVLTLKDGLCTPVKDDVRTIKRMCKRERCADDA